MTRVMEAWLARDRPSSWTLGRAMRALGHPGCVPGWAASRVTGCGFPVRPGEAAGPGGPDSR